MAAYSEAEVPRLRRGLLWLGALTTVGLVVELAAERHWTQPIMCVAWAAVALGAGGMFLLTGRASAARVRLARFLAILLLVSAALGVWEHVYSNFDAGSLDQGYADTWDALPLVTRWWLAVSKTVGPSPPLAPGALAQVGVCILLASLRHPALSRSDADRTA